MQIQLHSGILFDFSLSIKDMFGCDIPLSCGVANTSKDHFVFSYVDDKYSVNAGVHIQQEENFACIRLYADLDSLVCYDRRYSFFPYDTLTLKLSPVDDPDHVFGSCYYIGEKSDCWTRMFQANSLSHIENRVASLVWKSGSTYHHMLPLCDGAFKGEIKNIDDCLSITVSSYCGGFASIDCRCAIIAWGEDPFETAKCAVSHGFDVLGLPQNLTENKRLHPVFNYLGWCSWDSMGLDVTSAGLCQKAKEFQDKDIPVRWILIDDGWYPENSKKQITAFEEVPEKFPEGLKTLVSQLKQEYGLYYIGIWECYCGGWNGIAPDSPITQQYPNLVQALPNGYVFPKLDAPSNFAYWNTRHEYLKKCGIDFVKVDVECNLETCTQGIAPIGLAAKGGFTGLDASVGIYFDGACIHCTGMGLESLWTRPIGMVNRNSADFDPKDVKTMNQFVTNNIYNSYYHSWFSATDWDMMWSGGSDTVQINTILHAICGGPVYLSDPFQLTEPQIVRPFCLSSGQLLKCDGFTMPTEDRLFRDPQQEPIALKAWNKAGNCGILGVFHVYEKESPIHDCFRASDVPDLAGDSFFVYDWFSMAGCSCSAGDEYSFELSPYSGKLFLIAPYINDIAIIGNIDKYISPACIEQTLFHRNIATCVLKEGGCFAFATKRSVSVTANGELQQPQKSGELFIVDCTAFSGTTVIQITLE